MINDSFDIFANVLAGPFLFILIYLVSTMLFVSLNPVHYTILGAHSKGTPINGNNRFATLDLPKTNYSLVDNPSPNI